MIRTRSFLFGLLIFLTEISHPATLVVLDVGEGQSVLLKDGADAILVDTGHAGAAASVLKALEKYEVKALKAIVLTHLHPDHVSGWFRLHEAFPDAPTFYSGHNVAPLALDDVSRWVFEAITALHNYRKITAGDSIAVGRCAVNVIWPKDPIGTDLNANSLVHEVNCNGAKALLMADANTDVEKELMRNGSATKKADILVVGHHGASDSSDFNFITYVRPIYSVISVNSRNLRGYPSPDVEAKLKKIRSQVLRTDLQGDICFRLDQEDWELCAASN